MPALTEHLVLAAAPLLPFSRFAAEASAALTFRYLGSNPLLQHPDKLESDETGAATNGLWVGDSIDKLLAPGGAWAGKSRDERLELAATVGAGVMLAREALDNVPAEYGGSKMHRDIKPGNICIQETSSGNLLPVVIYFGGYCNQDLANSIVSNNALDPLQAAPYGSGLYAAVDSVEGARATTDPTIDMHAIWHRQACCWCRSLQAPCLRQSTLNSTTCRCR